MRCRRVPVLRLGSGGPGGDARSLRLWTQAFASVRKCSEVFAEGRTCRRDENRRETRNCRHFWTRLGSSPLKSVNRHKDRRGRGRETQNCRHFWTRLGSSRLNSVIRHRDPGGRGRETQNCRHFWSRRWREERREEKREMRGEKRGERREERRQERTGEARGERG